MSNTPSIIRGATRDLATLLAEPETLETNEKIEIVAGLLMVAVADGLATIVEASEKSLG